MADRPETPRVRTRVRVHEVSRGTRLRRIITPAAPLRGTHLTTVMSWHCGALFSTRAGLLQLGALFRLAAISPHSAVFLPLRTADVVSESAANWGRQNGLADLVVVRRDVPLRRSDWPKIRARLSRGPRPGAPATMFAPAARQPFHDTRWDAPRHELSVAEYADTVFFSATSRGLHRAGDELTWCGDQVAVNEDIHHYGGPALLSAFKGEVWRTGRPEDDWECDILAEDHRFQQAWEYRRGDGWVRAASPRYRFTPEQPSTPTD